MTQPAYLCIPGAEAARLIRDEPGLTLFDVGGPFWGLLLGLAVNRLLKA